MASNFELSLRKGGEEDERSSEDEGVKGGALVGLSQPYLGCGWFLEKQQKKKRVEYQMWRQI